MSNLVKIRIVGAEVFNADGRKDRYKEAKIRSSQFCEGTYNECVLGTSVKKK
jgi:hypothetical protein